jgi:hypothetical protein
MPSQLVAGVAPASVQTEGGGGVVGEEGEKVGDDIVIRNV